MARPRKQNLEYFPHDTDAVGDEKIEAIRALFGNDGYAFYFILLERIYRSEGATLDISRFAVRTALISKVGVTQERFDSMLEASFEIGLFDRDTYEQQQSLTSPGVRKRFSAVETDREKWRKKKETVAEQPEKQPDSDVIPEENGAESELSPEKTGEKTPQRKEKKSKEKDLKIHYAEFVRMTEEQYNNLVDQYGPSLAEEMVSVLDNYKGSNGKSYKDDYRAVLSWVVEKVLAKRKPADRQQGQNDAALRLIREAEEREGVRID